MNRDWKMNNAKRTSAAKQMNSNQKLNAGKPDTGKSMHYGIACLLVLLAALCRLAPHPMNFTPMLAVAIFGGATLPRRVAYALPLVAMLLSDLALGYSFGWMRLIVYGCFTADVGLGYLLREKRTPGRTVAATLAGSLFFYVVTNFFVWLPPSSLYEPTLSGLGRCYIMALPFFRNALLGDVCWTLGLFAVFEAAQSLARRHDTPLNSPTFKGPTAA